MALIAWILFYNRAGNRWMKLVAYCMAAAIPFAPVLAETPDRYGFNDFPFEFGAVRRGWLLVWDKKDNFYQSFALALARQANVSAEQVGSGLRIGKALFPRFERNERSCLAL